MPKQPSATHLPKGWHSVTPRLVVRDPKRLVEFLRRAFGATGKFDDQHPSIMKVGDSRLLVSGVAMRKPMPAFLYLYVANADATYRRSLRAGARSVETPTSMPYGDRRAMVRDPFGNMWQIATFGKLSAMRAKRARKHRSS